MKKEIENLLNSEKGYLKLNAYCELSRWQKDALGGHVDRLQAVFSIVHAFDYIEEITARNWQGIVEQVRKAHITAFAQASEELSRELKNGYIRGYEKK